MNDEILLDDDIISHNHESLFRCLLLTDNWGVLLDVSIRMRNTTINWICFDLHVLNCQLRADQTGVKSAEKYSSRRVF